MARGHALLFAGPSLPWPMPALPSAIRLRPPARCGDLLRCLDSKPTMVGLVDGVFELTASVWHKEILSLLDRGIMVFGAASLGALRAAELHPFGMIGVGRIYEAYRTGRIERDDAVMVSHAPPELEHRSLTVALVDAQASIAASGLPSSERRHLDAIAGRINFRDRTWERMFGDYARIVGLEDHDRAVRAIRVAAFSQKALDTLALIEMVSHQVHVPPPAPHVPHTVFLERLLDAVASEPD